MNKKKTHCILLFAFFSFYFSAQDNDSEIPKWEIVPSFIDSYSIKDKDNTFATELYTTYWFQEKWGAGISNTAKFKDNLILWDMAFLGSYKAYEWLCINSGLNIGFPHDKVRDGLEPGFYLETEFNFKLMKKAHFGIVLGTVLSENTELSAGLHFGFELPAKKPMYATKGH